MTPALEGREQGTVLQDPLKTPFMEAHNRPEFSDLFPRATK